MKTCSIPARSPRRAPPPVARDRAWVATFVLAIVVIATLLGGSLTTEGEPTNNPESTRAFDAAAAAFGGDPALEPTDIVVVRSDRHTVDSPEFERFVRELVSGSETASLGEARSYLDEGSGALVSEDRHATTVPLAIVDDEIEVVVAEVEAADEDAAFAVAMTGDQTLDHDFNALSQEDLEKGELQFGLPAALIILLLVFGTVVAAFLALVMAIVAIVVALGLTALVAQQFELSIFVVNMLTGMGLALGIDYELFVAPATGRSARGVSTSPPPSARRELPRAARSSSAARCSSSRCSGCCSCPTRS